MKTVTIDVRPLSDTLGDFTRTWKSGKASVPRISFESPELLFKALSGKRWELLNALTGAGPMSIREAEARGTRCQSCAWRCHRADQHRDIVEDRRRDDRLSL